MDNSSRIIDVDINDILPNRNQPRLILNEEDDLGLTDSVKEYGVLQPIIVRSIGDKYEIIAGERRYRASVLAGKETVPVIVRNMSDKDSAEIALIENVQRKELTPIEEALSYKTILDKGYMTQEQLAEKIGKSQPTIANKIRLLNLSEEVQDALLENKISERHARSLLKIKNKKQQNKMLDRIINERLTVRKTDEEIEKLGIEKGEEDMNNSMDNMPQFQSFTNNTQPVAPIQPAVEPTFVAPTPVEAPAQPQFNIFAEQPAQPAVEPTFVAPVAEAPVAETIPAVEAPAQPQFNIFAEQPAQPAVEPTFVAPTPVEAPAQPQFNIFAEQAAQPAVEPTFVAPVVESPVAETIPTVEAPAQPAVEPTFVAPVVESPVAETIPTVETPAQPAVEPTFVAPIVESPVAETVPAVEAPAPVEAVGTVEPTMDFKTADIQDSNVAAQPAPAVEPIIITDYNKQYDPVMPQAQVEAPVQVDFKEVIAAIRECANKIESYGYKIDVDEFDLTNIYQAIFKIEKM